MFALPAEAAVTSCTPSGTVPTGQPGAGAAYNNCRVVTNSGGDQTLAVPAGNYVESRVWGAAGATGYWVNVSEFGNSGYGGYGGAGAFAKGGFVANGTTLYVVVGDGGRYFPNGASLTTPYGGGGTRNPTAGGAFYQSQGGGLSGIFYGASPFGGSYGSVNGSADPIIVAGGGGGADASSWGDSPGSGGGLTGLTGTTSGMNPGAGGTCVASVYTPAGGGSQSGGGSKGTGSAVLAGSNSTNGSKWYGGLGSASAAGTSGGGDSSGGGAGYYGGGGGSATNRCDDTAGGGGSSFLSAYILGGSGSFATAPWVQAPSSGGAPNAGDPYYGGAAAQPTVTANGSGGQGGNGRVVVQWNSPLVKMVKTTTPGSTGTNVFNFTHTGLTTTAGVAAGTTAISVVDAATVIGAQRMGTLNTSQSVAESTIPGSFFVTGMVCNDANTAITGNTNPVAQSGVADVTSISIPAAAMRNGADISCTFVNAQRTLTKAFATPSIVPGASTTLTFTLTNPANGAATTASFTDTLPSSLRIAAAPAIGGTCTNASTATAAAAGGTAITVTNAAVPAGTSSCTVTVAVTNLAGATNASCTTNPAAFTNTTTNVTGLSANFFNGVTAQCLMVAPAPTVKLAKTTTNGTGSNSFGYTLTGLGNTSDTVAVTGAATVASGTTQVGSVGTAVTMQESSVPTGWPTNPTGVSCLDANTAASGNVTTNLATLSGNTASLPATAMRGSAVITCTFTNTARPDMSVTKSDGVSSVMSGASTAYVVTVTNSGAVASTVALVDPVATGLNKTIVSCGAVPGVCTTPPSVAALQAGFTTPSIPAGGSYQLTVNATVTAAVGASVSNVATATVATSTGTSCAAAGGTFNAGTGACSATDTDVVAAAPTVTLAKNSVGGTGSFAFTLVGVSNTSDSITTVTSGATATSAANHTGTVGAASSATETAVAGYTTSTSCLDGNSAVTGNTVAISSTNTTATIPAANMRAGASYTCTFTNTASPSPRVQIVKTTVSGTGSNVFSFALGGLSQPGDSITVVGAGTASGAATITGTAATAVSIAETPPAGWPANPVSASCVDSQTATSGNPSGPLGTLSGNVLSIPAANMVNGAVFSCTFINAFGFSVTGRVFTDNGVGSGTPNDGVMNGSEAGMAGVSVRLTNCSGTVYAQGLTSGSGSYALIVPGSVAAGAPLCVEETNPGVRVSTGASVSTTALPSGFAVTVGGTSYTYARTGAPDRIAFAFNGAGHSGLNFGDVDANTFAADGVKTGLPGNTVVYAHTFTARTGGVVSFSIASSVATPALNGWNEKVLTDVGCTGTLQAGAAVLYPPAAPMTVVAGQQVCIVMQEFIPATAQNGYIDTVTVQAGFTFTNAAPALSASYQVTDVTTVSSAALDLKKEVRNVTQAGVFGINNQAKSGETLEYRITYTNNAAAPISTLAINDTTPAYSSFVSALAGSTPSTLTACMKTTPANPLPAATVTCPTAQATGGTGPLDWKFTGSLAPGGTGTVLFQVKVN
ncbi:putative repeat protein (TIGR01451 family) [Variovorax sp. GrIS 2.14]|uniref:beta strand repeat-containing protein n=1 Tax=Variovorax sp. GrIS 2.14 TaxID=3071709 RepID=UPI0038F68D90